MLYKFNQVVLESGAWKLQYHCTLPMHVLGGINASNKVDGLILLQSLPYYKVNNSDFKQVHLSAPENEN